MRISAAFLRASAMMYPLFFTLLVLLSSLTTFAQTESKLKRSKRSLPNQYIVVLENKDSLTDTFARTDTVDMAARELSLFYGGRVKNLYSSVVQGFAVEMSPAQAARLSRDKRVKYVEEDGIVRKEQSQQDPPWGLDRIDQRYSNLDKVYSYDTTGTGVHAYVMDTGIRGTHSEFGGRVVFGADFVGDGQNGNDCDGHGTHVAGIIGGATYGVAKNVNIHNVRVLGCDGSGTTSGVLAAIEWITNNHVSPAVVNMSLGSDEPSVAVENAIAASISQGVHYALAAGNGDPAISACDHSPGGRVPTAVAVAATSQGDFKAWFSNYGSCVTVFAPGEDILSAWNTSDTASEKLSGTSMAAPHVAGVMARVLQTDPSASPAQLKAALLLWASPVVVNGGPGSPTGLIYSKTSLTSVPAVSAIRLPHSGGATPYPSTFTVSGAPNVLSTKPGSLQVNINGFAALYADHVAFVLVGPDGTAMMLQQQKVSSFYALDVDYSITDTGYRGYMGHYLGDGDSYRPTADSAGFSNFPAPGPGTNYVVPGWLATPWKTLSGTFGGKDPNGVWKLYAMDIGFYSPHTDATIGNWSISINNPPPPYVPLPPESPTPSPTPITSPTPISSPTPVSTPLAVYDIVGDFSLANNPSGPWSYGYSKRNVSEITLFPNSGEPWSGIRTWSPIDNGPCCGMVTKNTTGGPLVYYGTILHDPNFLYMETGPYGENTTVRFTAPVAGAYRFRGRFQALDTAYRGIYLKIKPQPFGFEIWSSYIQGFGLNTDFTFLRTLEANQSIDFVLGQEFEQYTMGVGLSGTVALETTPSPTPTPAPTLSPSPTPNPSPSPTPLLATVDGRVLTPIGGGLRNATVSISDSNGVIRTASTSTLGYFSLDNIPAGPAYIISVASKRYRFTSQPIQFNGHLTLPDFVGLE